MDAVAKFIDRDKRSQMERMTKLLVKRCRSNHGSAYRVWAEDGIKICQCAIDGTGAEQANSDAYDTYHKLHVFWAWKSRAADATDVKTGLWQIFG